eukprot:5917397-Amphidinium_carterae.1
MGMAKPTCGLGSETCFGIGRGGPGKDAATVMVCSRARPSTYLYFARTATSSSTDARLRVAWRSANQEIVRNRGSTPTPSQFQGLKTQLKAT